MQSKATFPVQHPTCVNKNVRRFPHETAGQQHIYTEPHFINVLIMLFTTNQLHCGQ